MKSGLDAMPLFLKVAIAKFFRKMQRKTWYEFHFGGGRHASFPQKTVVT